MISYVIMINKAANVHITYNIIARLCNHWLYINYQLDALTIIYS